MVSSLTQSRIKWHSSGVQRIIGRSGFKTPEAFQYGFYSGVVRTLLKLTSNMTPIMIQAGTKARLITWRWASMYSPVRSSGRTVVQTDREEYLIKSLLRLSYC